jgi:CheY-like chemotaxis protein
MNPGISSGKLDHLYREAQFLVEQASKHQDEAQALLSSADGDVRQAEAALTDARSQRADFLCTLLWAQHQARIDSADALRHLREGARKLDVVARRLFADLDAEAHEPPHPACSRGATVLVVDDYQEGREVVARVLENAGFVVRTAVNGLEGLIAAYEMRPGVIVMDVAMPVLDGIEATRLIKAGEATRHARVIAYTGNSELDPSIAERLFVAVLQKPAMPGTLLATVQHVASQ